MPQEKLPRHLPHRTNPSAWALELQQWEESPYDGIKGVPPSWVPDPQKKVFFRQRFLLLQFVSEGKASYTEIKSRFDDLVTQKYHAIVLALLKDCKPYDESLRDCVRLFKAASLQPAEGLKVLAGEDAARGYKSRTAHQKRADHIEKQEVQEIGLKLWHEDPLLTYAEIERSPKMRIYKRRYKGRHTLRDWLKEIDPYPDLRKRGRPHLK